MNRTYINNHDTTKAAFVTYTKSQWEFEPVRYFGRIEYRQNGKVLYFIDTMISRETINEALIDARAMLKNNSEYAA